LASVLKPLDDTRMYEKFACTLAADFDEVHVLGFPAPLPAGAPPNVHFHALPSFGRAEAGRWRAGLALWALLRRIRPQAVVVHAVELLPFAAAFRAAAGQGVRVVYDIRENYAQNIWQQRVYPRPWNFLLALAVRAVEWACRPWLDGLCVAERCYAQDMLLARRAVVAENKYAGPPPAPCLGGRRLQGWKLAYVGSISELYGIREAVAWCEALRAQAPVSLHITGYCGDARLRGWLEGQAAAKDWIRLEGIGRLVPHARVLAAMQEADACLLPYRPHPSTRDCLPTKLYECLALGIPMFVQENARWEAACAPAGGAVMVDFGKLPRAGDAQAWAGRTFYPQGPDPQAYWASEAGRVRALVGGWCHSHSIRR
jgi:hypothetical protein